MVGILIADVVGGVCDDGVGVGVGVLGTSGAAAGEGGGGDEGAGGDAQPKPSTPAMSKYGRRIKRVPGGTLPFLLPVVQVTPKVALGVETEARHDEEAHVDRVGAARDTDGESEGEPRIQSDNPERTLDPIVES